MKVAHIGVSEQISHATHSTLHHRPIDRIIVGALNNDGCRKSKEINNDNKVYLIIIFHKIEMNGRHCEIVIKWFEYYDKKFEINGK